MTKQLKPTLLVVDDHRVVLEGLTTSFSDVFEVIGTASDGQAAVDLAKELNPDVVIMDLNMPLMNGIEATRQIHAALPNTKIVILTMISDFESVLASIDAGASGYINKCAGLSELLEAINNILKGKQCIPQDFMDHYTPNMKLQKDLYPYVVGGLIHDSLNTMLALRYTIRKVETSAKNELKSIRANIEHIDSVLRAIQSISRNYYQIAQDTTEGYLAKLNSIVQKFRNTHESINYKCHIPKSIDFFRLPLGVLDFIVGELLENSSRICADRSNAEIILSLSINTEDKNLSIKCEDSGPGLPANVLDMIHSGQIKPPVDQAIGGYGLYLLNEIINRIGGTILASNIEGSGASIEILFPI